MAWKRSVPISCWAAGLPAALVLGLLLGTWSAPTALSLPSQSDAAPVSAGPSDLRLTVDPASWWMVAGNSTRFEAAWADVPPGCTNAPVSFRWSVVAGWAEGTVSPVDAPIVDFTASSVATGTAEIEVRSVTVVTCANHEVAASQNATTTVTVVVPPKLGPLAFSTDPVGVGVPTNLTGSLLDGEPPYRVWVTWEDGTFSEFNLSNPGPFSLLHVFPAGRFASSVTVEDSSGLTTNGSVVEAEYSGTNLTVGIETARYSTEVGAPVAFTGTMLDPPAVYSELAACSGTGLTASPPPRFPYSVGGSTTNFTCTFSAPGTAEVTYEVIPSGDDLPPATATLALPVRAPLGLGVALARPSTEVGIPATVAVEVSGGVAPFAVHWGLVGRPNGSNTTLVADGTLLVPVNATIAGSFGITVVVEDAIGFEVGNSSVQLSVDLALNASASVATSIEPGGPEVYLAGAVTQGAAPFLWFVAPGVRPVNDTAPEGNLSVISEFAWTGQLLYEGNASIGVGVLDADGAIWWADLPVRPVPPLEGDGRLTVIPGNETPLLVVNLTVRGGLPPFTVWANSTGRSEGNSSVTADGSYSWSWPVNATGTVREEVTVVDRIGARWFENTTVTFPPAPPGAPSPAPPSSPSPSPTGPTSASANGAGISAEVAGITTLALLAAGGLAVYWRQRRAARAPAPPAPDPVVVLRQIIEPADGVDRTTVELLAEEAGVSLAVARATLDRLVTEGRLRSETGSDGEEVYAWSPRDAS